MSYMFSPESNQRQFPTSVNRMNTFFSPTKIVKCKDMKDLMQGLPIYLLQNALPNLAWDEFT